MLLVVNQSAAFGLLCGSKSVLINIKKMERCKELRAQSFDNKLNSYCEPTIWDLLHVNDLLITQ